MRCGIEANLWSNVKRGRFSQAFGRTPREQAEFELHVGGGEYGVWVFEGGVEFADVGGASVRLTLKVGWVPGRGR